MGEEEDHRSNTMLLLDTKVASFSDHQLINNTQYHEAATKSKPSIEFHERNYSETIYTTRIEGSGYALRENPRKSWRLLSSGSEIYYDRNCYSSNINRKFCGKDQEIESSPTSDHDSKHQSKQERKNLEDCRKRGVRSMKSKHNNSNDNFVMAKSVFESLRHARRKKRSNGNNYNSILSMSLLNASSSFDSREELEDALEVADCLLMLSGSGGTSELDIINEGHEKRRKISKEAYHHGCSSTVGSSNSNVASISLEKKFESESTRIGTDDVSSLEMGKGLKFDAEITRELNSVEWKADTLRLKLSYAPKVQMRAASMQMVS